MMPQYRVWSERNKRMYRVTEMNWDGIRFSVTGYPMNPKQRTGICGMSVDMFLMRSTGIKDNNDRMVTIFAKDLVRIVSRGYDPNNIYEVVDLEYKFVLRGSNHTTGEMGYMDIDPKKMKFQVVSNTHENPKLLEETRNK